LKWLPRAQEHLGLPKRIKGQSSPITVTLGKYPAMSIENARKQALEALNVIPVDKNPNENERTKKTGRNNVCLEVY